MLFFLGKDVSRWIDQCIEWVGNQPALADADGLRPQSFAGLLTASPPEPVKAKLLAWGVADHSAIFARAIVINAAFAEPPALAALAEAFLRSYHRYADYLFRCYIDSQPHCTVTAANFHFQLYASGEYSRLLETQWASTG